MLAPIISSTPGEGQPKSQAAAHRSIVLAAFTGDQQAENATMGVLKARTEGGLPGAYAEKREKATVVAYGKYDSPDDPQAKADLEMIRTLAGRADPLSPLPSSPRPSRAIWPAACPSWTCETPRSCWARTGLCTRSRSPSTAGSTARRRRPTRSPSTDAPPRRRR